MALHGDVRINGNPIGFWSAQRLDELKDNDQISLYHCEYDNGFFTEEAVIEHRYSDGAEVLAQKVLTLAEGGW